MQYKFNIEHYEKNYFKILLLWTVWKKIEINAPSPWMVLCYKICFCFVIIFCVSWLKIGDYYMTTSETKILMEP